MSNPQPTPQGRSLCSWASPTVPFPYCEMCIDFILNKLKGKKPSFQRSCISTERMVDV